MESMVLDGVVGASLVPTVMAMTVGKMHSQDNSDLLYLTVTLGTIIGTVANSMNFQFRLMAKTRNQLTILTSILLTLSMVASTVGFHLIRHNYSSSKTYILPSSIIDQNISSSSLVFRRHFHADLIPGLILMSQVQLCSMIGYDLMNKAKRRFKFGESTIIAQLVSAAYSVWAFCLYSKLTTAGPFEVDQTTDIILNVAMIVFTLVFLPSYLLIQRKNTLLRYGLIISSISASYIVTRLLVATSGFGEPLTWLIDHIFSTHQRISLFSLWLSTLVACISFSTSWSRIVGKTNSLVRKVFHLALCVVFISGYNQDIDFTRFAGGGMLIVMTLLEMVRIWNLWPIGGHLERICQSLRGQWDNRYLTVSHIYLLVGILLPLWLLPKASEPSKLLLSSGLISLGVGDSAAAIVGTFYGKTKFGLKSGKTLEGFMGNIISMMLFKLIWIGYVDFIEDYSFIMAATITAFVEAISSNCDNLILPLVMMLLLEVF